jgi:hypothetical protein
VDPDDEKSRTMIAKDRRLSQRRANAYATSFSPSYALTMDRRSYTERRQTARRRTDMRTIAQYADIIGAGDSRLEVIVDGSEGLRLVAMFSCGCSAVEPIGTGKPSVRIEPCGPHFEPRPPRERRRKP